MGKAIKVLTGHVSYFPPGSMFMGDHSERGEAGGEKMGFAHFVHRNQTNRNEVDALVWLCE